MFTTLKITFLNNAFSFLEQDHKVLLTSIYFFYLYLTLFNSNFYLTLLVIPVTNIQRVHKLLKVVWYQVDLYIHILPKTNELVESDPRLCVCICLIVILSNLKKSDMRSFPRLDPPKSKVEGINVYSTYNEQHIIYKTRILILWIQILQLW